MIKLTEKQIKQLIQILGGVEPIVKLEAQTMKIWTFTEVVKDQTSNKINTDESDRTHDKQNKHYTSSDSMKLQTLVDQYVFAFNKPARTQRLFNVDIYKAVGSKVPFECIKGIQRIRDTWRIFMNDSEDRITLIVEVLNMRGMWVPLHAHNSQRIQPDTIRIKENNISFFPLMTAKLTVTLEGCSIECMNVLK